MCVSLRFGGVVERRIERIDIRRQSNRSAGDARRQRGGVAKDVDIAIDIRRDRRERFSAAEVVIDVEITEREFVAERLFELRELTSIAELHRRTRRREWVPKNVVDIDAIPAVHVHFLIEDARRDAEFRVRFEEERDASAGTAAAVDVFLDAEVRLHGVHVSAVIRVVRRNAHRRGVADRHIDGRLRAAADAAVRDRAQVELADFFVRADLRLIADVTDGAGQRAGAEQCALRSAQHFDTRHVEEIDVGREE